MKKYKKLLSAAALLVIAAMALTGTVFADTGDACVTASALNMRTGGSLDCGIIDVAPQGAHVNVLSDDGSGWCQVSYNGKTGYMSRQYLSFGGGTETTVVSGNGNGCIQGTYVRFRSGPSTGSSVYGYLHTGTGVQVNGAVGSWYEVVFNGTTGYVYGDYVVLNGSQSVYTVSTPAVTAETAPVYTEPTYTETVVETASSEQIVVDTTPAQQELYTDTSVSYEETVLQPAQQETTQTSTYVAYNAAGGQQIVDTAMQFLGVPYVWGGTSPDEGFDCSGLVYYVYGLCGYSLNRVAQSMYYNGVEVPLDALQPGDILLFGSSVYNIWHAAIYIGNGQFIHSPYSGQVVSVSSFSESSGLNLVAARRVV